MAIQNTLSFSQDHEHRKVVLSPESSSIVQNINLVYYAPGVCMPLHSHSTAQFSTLMSGQATQTTAFETIEQQYGVAEFKPAGFNHSNQIGPHGAIMLSVNLRTDSDVFSAEFGQPKWALSEIRPTEIMWQMLRNTMLNPSEAPDIDAEACVISLLTSARSLNTIKRPPLWLRVAEQALNETTLSVADIASYVGVHRVHLCRTFQACFGVSVSQYRQMLSLQRGITSLVCSKKTITTASIDAGFSDQSHFTRVLRRHLGTTPGQMKALFSERAA